MISIKRNKNCEGVFFKNKFRLLVPPSIKEMLEKKEKKKLAMFPHPTLRTVSGEVYVTYSHLERQEIQT